MNLADKVRLLAAHKAAVAALEASLKAEAADAFETQGVAPTWRIPGVGRVSGSLTRGRVDIADPDSLLDYLETFYPTEVHRYEVREVRNREWLTRWLEALAAAPTLADDGQTPLDGQNRPVPGLVYTKGGRFLSASVTIDSGVKASLAKLAKLYASGSPEVMAQAFQLQLEDSNGNRATDDDHGPGSEDGQLRQPSE